ncbi:SMP-30/gluconolactonase/LRE family protein [Noviherbaspirillum sp. Root189]|uniref:SMP-30/gluconolactonase/LRE family protein n=1 Tax=Noviherbaspirillum sp. Root189 TaxID=1736487 RepID=UPI001F21C594|nr:SMP-30/gluconolactonase/LRE family protein [Noviherbaspirillum sp. Root189]
MHIAANGEQTLKLPASQTGAEQRAGFKDRYVMAVGSLPNGLALLDNGDILIANWGTDSVDRFSRDGSYKVLHTEIDGRPIGKANFVMRDSKGRIWLTVTTRMSPWTESINSGVLDGYLALMDDKGMRIVAEGFGGTNEVKFDANEEWLYVVESNARRISRLRVQPDGSLTDREFFGPSRLEGFPDGFAFDAFGNLWVTLIMSDKLIALTPQGDVLTILDDGNPEATARLNRHWHEKSVTPDIMAQAKGTLAPWMASITFGGSDLRTVYLGSLLGTTIPCFRSPVPGLPLAHWGGQRFA